MASIYDWDKKEVGLEKNQIRSWNQRFKSFSLQLIKDLKWKSTMHEVCDLANTY